MTLLDRLFRPAHDDRAEVRPLWDAVVAEARQPRWYRALGVADSVAGRFDMVTLVLGAVLLRLERDDPRGTRAARLTELFVADMDAQLRQSGVGDLVVGKHVGKLMATLGGRLGALREALAADGAVLQQALERNVTLRDGFDGAALADETRALAQRIDGLAIDALLAGRLAP